MKTLLTAVAIAVLLAACSSSTTGGSGGGTGTGGGTAGGSAGGSAGGAGGGTAGGSGGAGGGSVDPLCASDGGLSRCACPGFTLCENFEAATVDTATWTLDSDNGSAVIDTTKSVRGSNSLHVSIKSGGGNRALLKETKSFPATDNHVFGRAFVFAKSPAPTVHTGLFTLNGALAAGNAEVRFGLDHHGVIEPNYWTSTGTEYGIFSPVPVTRLPVDAWTCLEWEYKGADNELHFFVDGTEIPEIKVLGSFSPPWKAPTYSAFQLGMILYQSDTATSASFEAWFDEVALSNTRIGCVK